MAKTIQVGILLLVVLVATVIPQGTDAAEHVVGGAQGWIIPQQGASFYTALDSKTTFTQNDILVFNFKTGAHNVVTLSKKNYENCNVNDPIESFNTGPTRITLNRTGEFYFACAFPSHCILGQKLSINVTAASSSSSSSPAPAKTTPSSDATVHVAAATFAGLIALAINVLF